LDAANIDDVHRFYDQYYSPNNAVMAIVGDFSADELFAQVQNYFADVPGKSPPPRADISEGVLAKERRATQPDSLAKVPALAVGYRAPSAETHDALVGSIVGEL